MSYIMPSLTPTDGMPAFRVYSVDPVTFGVLDSVTYIADMTNPAFQTTGPVWTKYYSAKEAYGSLVSSVPGPEAELTPAFWHNVTAALQSSETAFQDYWTKKTRGWNVPACNDACKTSTICQLQAARSQDNCYVTSPGVHFKKRGSESHSHGAVYDNHCGESLLKDVFLAVMGQQ
jgi:sphingomyelin phosphodiesterase